MSACLQRYPILTMISPSSLNNTPVWKRGRYVSSSSLISFSHRPEYGRAPHRDRGACKFTGRRMPFFFRSLSPSIGTSSSASSRPATDPLHPKKEVIRSLFVELKDLPGSLEMNTGRTFTSPNSYDASILPRVPTMLWCGRVSSDNKSCF